jgi:hypothetical protein
MQRIHDYVDVRFSDLGSQPVFQRLAADEPAATTLQVLPHLTFWSMVFQDILVLNAARVETAALRDILSTHGSEDMGHELWFLQDLRLIYRRTPDVTVIFDHAHLQSREFSYAFMSEVYRAESDGERMLLPHILEEGAKIFLPALIDHFERAGVGVHFRALGRHHLETEALHALHGDAVTASIATIRLTDEEHARARAMVDRCHATFLRFAAVLNDAIVNSSPDQSIELGRRLDEISSM